MMKFAELYEDEEGNEYRIFVDMDGVLADFEAGVDALLEKAKKEGREIEPRKKAMWREIKHLEKKKGRFWYNLDPMKDAKTLWQHVRKHKPAVLSATGTVGNNVSGQKGQWMGEQFGWDIPVITTVSSKEKAEYAAPNHILVDDREKSIGPWREAGGIGILHTSAANTIKELKKLGL